MVNPSTSVIIISLVLSLIITVIPSVHSQSQLSVTPIRTACPGLRKSSKIQVYVQDPLQGANQTVFPAAQASIPAATSPSNFTVIRVADNKLTAGPDYDSLEVGRAQGTVTAADLRVYAISMAVNFYFTAGIYNGSVISVSGRNQVFTQQNRELAVVGGTGIFRCARGYATAETYSVDPATRNGVYLYTFYINYYQNGRRV